MKISYDKYYYFLKSFSAAEEGCSPIKPEPGSPNSIHSEEITAHVATENHQSPGKDSKQEIPKGKGKLKKKNSLRKMLSCFSSKAAQADWSETGQLFDI